MSDRESRLVEALEMISLNCASAAWARTVANDALRKHGEAPEMSPVGQMAFDIAATAARDAGAVYGPSPLGPLLEAQRKAKAFTEAMTGHPGVPESLSELPPPVQSPPADTGSQGVVAPSATPAAASEGRHCEGCGDRDPGGCPGLPAERGGVVGCAVIGCENGADTTACMNHFYEVVAALAKAHPSPAGMAQGERERIAAEVEATPAWNVGNFVPSVFALANRIKRGDFAAPKGDSNV